MGAVLMVSARELVHSLEGRHSEHDARGAEDPGPVRGSIGIGIKGRKTTQTCKKD